MKKGRDERAAGKEWLVWRERRVFFFPGGGGECASARARTMERAS